MPRSPGRSQGVTLVASPSNPAGKALPFTGKGKWWKGMWGGERCLGLLSKIEYLCRNQPILFNNADLLFLKVFTSSSLGIHASYGTSCFIMFQDRWLFHYREVGDGLWIDYREGRFY